MKFGNKQKLFQFTLQKCQNSCEVYASVVQFGLDWIGPICITSLNTKHAAIYICICIYMVHSALIDKLENWCTEDDGEGRGREGSLGGGCRPGDSLTKSD